MQPVLDSLQVLEKHMGLAVQGNWEFWLTHPERDENNKYQEKYRSQLTQRRELLGKKENNTLLKRLSRDTVQI